MDLWLKSYERNPDPNALYTTQISSTKELLERTQQICGKKGMSENNGTLGQVSQRLNELIDRLKNTSEKQNCIMLDSLDISKHKN